MFDATYKVRRRQHKQGQRSEPTSVLRVGAGGGADATFLRAVHYADAVVWDQKRRLIKHVLNLRGGKRKEIRRRGQKSERKGDGE